MTCLGINPNGNKGFGPGLVVEGADNFELVPPEVLFNEPLFAGLSNGAKLPLCPLLTFLSSLLYESLFCVLKLDGLSSLWSFLSRFSKKSSSP